MVNQMRLVQRVMERKGQGKDAYGVFIDFSSAYNTILHTKLYERLRALMMMRYNCLEPSTQEPK